MSQGDQDSSASFVGCSFQQNTITRNSAEDYDHSVIHAKTWERDENSQHTTQVLVRAVCFLLPADHGSYICIHSLFKHMSCFRQSLARLFKYKTLVFTLGYCPLRLHCPAA